MPKRRKKADMQQLTTVHSLAEFILLLRVRAGMKRSELAAEAGLSLNTIWRYENGTTHSPNLVHISSVCDVLAPRPHMDSHELLSMIVEFSRAHQRDDRVYVDTQLEVMDRSPKRTA